MPQDNPWQFIRKSYSAGSVGDSGAAFSTVKWPEYRKTGGAFSLLRQAVFPAGDTLAVFVANLKLTDGFGVLSMYQDDLIAIRVFKIKPLYA